MSEFVKMRISQDKLPSAIGLGRAVPNGRTCKPRAKGELRDPGDRVRREVVAELLACSKPGRKGCETPLAQVVTALNPWWSKNQDSTLPEVLADLIAPRGKDALAAEVNENVDRLTRERDEAVAEAAELRERAERAEAELDGLRIPYRLGTDHYCTYENEGEESYVRMGDMISHVYDTPFGEFEMNGELCSVRYGEGGFIDTISVYVAGKEMDYDVPCEGVFYRMNGGGDGHVAVGHP